MPSSSEPVEGASILPYFANLEQTLRRDEEKVEIEANRALSEASQRSDARLATARQELRQKEAARRQAIAADVVAAAQQKLERALSSLDELEMQFLKSKDHAVRFGLAWILGENPR